MATKLTLEQAKQVLKDSPPPGTVVRRADFKQIMFESEYKGHTFMACTNYHCRGLLGDDQRMVLNGLHCTIWIGRTNAYNFTVARGQGLQHMLGLALQAALDMCQHESAREIGQDECKIRGISHFGACYHVHECWKCHGTFAIDSSD